MQLNPHHQFQKCTFKGEKTVKERHKTLGTEGSFVCHTLEGTAILAVSEWSAGAAGNF